MSRPADWSPLAAADPVPGDPVVVEEQARRMARLAEELEGQVGVLRGIAAADGLEGEYVVTLREGALRLADRLGRVVGRYREAGGALEGYAPRLEQAQSDSAELLVRARDAEDERRRQESLAGGIRVPSEPLPVPPSADPAQQAVAEADAERARRAREHALAEVARHREAAATASAEVDATRRDLARVTGERDHAAEAAARAVRDAADDDVTDSWFDNVKDWFHANAGWIKTVTKVLGYVAVGLMVLSLFVPGLNVLVWAGAAVSLTMAAGHTGLAFSGDGSWAEVGLDAFAVLTLGAGGMLSSGVRIGGRTIGGGLSAAHAELRSVAAVRAGRLAAREANALTGPARRAAGALMSRGGPGSRQAAGAWRAAEARRVAQRAAARTAAVRGTRNAPLPRVRAWDIVRYGSGDAAVSAQVVDALQLQGRLGSAARVSQAANDVVRASIPPRVAYGASAVTDITGIFLDTVPANQTAAVSAPPGGPAMREVRSGW